MMRLYAGHYLSKVANLGGPGVDELRWLAPVRPGELSWTPAALVVAHGHNLFERWFR
jgi:hypothetical protein